MLAATALCAASAPCAGAPEEIQVYIDDLTSPGHFGTDFHNNDVLSGRSSPDYAGAQAPAHVYRFTPEFYYGMSDTLELGLYVLTALRPDNGTAVDGEKLRLKFVAPHDRAQGPFWGANLEIGRTDRAFAEHPWNGELKGIYGFRTGRWMFAVNPNLDWSLSSGGGPASAEIDTKIAYQTDAGYQAGFESYNELGSVRDLGHLEQRSQMFYGVIDAAVGKFDLNVGLGRGLTSASDRWVLKFIVGGHY